MKPIFLFSLFMALDLLALSAPAGAGPATEPDKPRIAIFPLGGSATEKLRDRCGFALRAKLDRADAGYEVLDGPLMKEVAAELGQDVAASAAEAKVRELAKSVDAPAMVWGELNHQADGDVLQLNILDLREPTPKVRRITRTIAQPQDLRFVTEEILQSLPGVATFEHPSESGVQRDATAEELWKTNKNLVANADFSDNGAWDAIYMAEKYPVKISDSLPAIDKVNIYALKEGGKSNNVLAMNLSKECAENNGMACLSAAIPIEPNTRYRIRFRYRSDGPTLHVFVKGYTSEGRNLKGEKSLEEVYRRQVPPSGATGGKWVEVVDELNPQHTTFPVKYLKIDLYAYLTPGVVLFDDITLKAVGKQNDKAAGKEFQQPVTRPAGAK